MEHDTLPTHEFDKNYVVDGKIMLFSVFGLAVAVSAVFFFRSHFRRRRSRRDDYSGAGGTTTQGVDLSALKFLPTFIYSSATDDPMLECAVCLSQFQNDEPGRVLPRCDHTFHAGCIDTWLHSHSSCPLCRVPVQTGGAPVRVKPEAGCSSASPPEPSFSLLMGIASLV